MTATSRTRDNGSLHSPKTADTVTLPAPPEGQHYVLQSLPLSKEERTFQRSLGTFSISWADLIRKIRDAKARGVNLQRTAAAFKRAVRKAKDLPYARDHFANLDQLERARRMPEEVLIHLHHALQSAEEIAPKNILRMAEYDPWEE